MAAPNHPPNGDVENGATEKEMERTTLPNDSLGDDNEDVGEYGNLVRYISQYKDGRRQSTVAGDDDEVKRPWWKFWAKKSSGFGSGSDNFETPDDWLETNMQQGLKSTDVESRRKRTGWNELTTEKENLFLKFLGFFTGPILYGKPHQFVSQLP
jgi:H+-transporting ATPase